MATNEPRIRVNASMLPSNQGKSVALLGIGDNVCQINIYMMGLFHFDEPYMALIGADGSLNAIHSFIPFWWLPVLLHVDVDGGGACGRKRDV